MPETGAKAAGPSMPITAGQIRALHAIGRRRGLSHEDLREVTGVASLKDLSVTEGAQLLDRLQTDDHRRDWEPDEPNRASARNVIRNATRRQRNYIGHLFTELRWNGEKAAEWPAERHGIRDLANDVFTSRTASEAVYQLEQALKKQQESDDTTSALDGSSSHS